jgi:hypothetical protein
MYSQTGFEREDNERILDREQTSVTTNHGFHVYKES